MKKLLFTHSGEKVKKDSLGNLYTDGSYNSDVWKRYKKLADKVSVIFRIEDTIYEKEEAEKKFQPLDSDIDFYPMKNRKDSIKSFLSLKNKKYNKNLVLDNVKKNDIIIARVPSEISYYAIKYANKYNKKLIVEVVGCAFDSMWYHSFKGKILAIPEYLKLKYYLKKSKNAIYVSNGFLQRRYPNHGYNIGCSDVVINEVSAKNLNNRLKQQKKVNDKIIIGTVGALNTKYKGQQYVIKAMSELIKKGYNLEYWLIGGGSDDYLRKVVKKYNLQDKVVFLGPKSHEDVFKLMNKMDIYIQPSNAESHGRVILEAMSMSCPCIGSTTGGIPELVNKDFVFKRKNVKDLENKIEKMINGNFGKMAIYSFEKAKLFLKTELDQKRDEFYYNALKNKEE